MRQKFENDLVDYNKIIKEKDKPTEAFKDVDIDQVVKYLEIEAARKQGTDDKTQEEIYKIQVEKQKVMDRLHFRLNELDNPDSEPEKVEGNRELGYNDEKKRFMYFDDNGKKWSGTLGQILTDVDWGIEYNLDLKAIPRAMAKKYYVGLARKRLMELLDKQIIKSEVVNKNNESTKKDAYRIVGEDRESGHTMEKRGFISEVIVKNFLERVSVDHDLPFEIREADVYQDVEQKIDFIIHVKDRTRGVEVKSDEDSESVYVGKKEHDFGIQFTTNPNAEDFKKKLISKAMARMDQEKIQDPSKRKNFIEDVYLVVLPLNLATDMRDAWVNTGRLAGGPSRFMYSDTAEIMFRGLLKNMFSDNEIGEFWNKVKVEFNDRPELQKVA